MKIPHCLTSESAAIGAVIQDPTLACELRLDLFHHEPHRAIVEVLAAMLAEGTAIDEITAKARLGTHLHLVVDRAIDDCPSPANFPAWKETLTVKAALRNAWQYHGEARGAIESLPDEAGNEQAREVLSQIESRFIALGGHSGGDDADDGVASGLDAMFDDLERGAGLPTVTTGLPELDRMVRLRPGQMVVVGARPSQGKTALGCRILENVVLQNRRPAGMFSLEMPRGDILRRMVSGLSGVPYADIENPDGSQQDAIVAAGQTLRASPLRICDTAGLTVDLLANHARRWRIRHKVELLVIDYLGLVRLGGRQLTKYEEATEVSRRLKQMARELGVVLVVLAQLNRQAADDGEEPRMHHLRDSGAIEQDADVIALLHTKDVEGGGRTRRCKLLVDKQRNGAVGDIALTFNAPTMRFDSESPIDPRDIPRR
jgi:replicative DNA helicase